MRGEFHAIKINERTVIELRIGGMKEGGKGATIAMRKKEGILQRDKKRKVTKNGGEKKSIVTVNSIELTRRIESWIVSGALFTIHDNVRQAMSTRRGPSRLRALIEVRGKRVGKYDEAPIWMRSSLRDSINSPFSFSRRPFSSTPIFLMCIL